MNDFNSSGFRILNAWKRNYIVGTIAEFCYRGHIVSMSQEGGINAHCPSVYDGLNLLYEAESVEDALGWIDAIANGKAMAEAAKR